MDKKLDISVNTELKADLQPVIEHTPNAINKIFELLFGVKHAKEKRIIELINSQTAREKILIEQGLATFDIEVNTIDNMVPSNHATLLSSKINNDEALNITNCAKYAVNELVDVTLPPDKEISNDFFNRWRNEAKLIDNEYTQKIWGLILSEEIKSPDSISLRTLDTLKNLSQYEAELFNTMGNYIVFGSFILTGEHIDESHIKTLVDAGLCIFAGIYRSSDWLETQLTYHDNAPQPGYYIDFNHHMFFHEKKLSISFVPLTSAGMEIYKISSNNNSWNLALVARAIFERNSQISEITSYKYNDPGKSNIINMDESTIFHRDVILKK
ncbi:DUF2806 domain-containing protein [Aeromonas jandaei]|nr:DUF2806 domain-containing protein [Aeromonas jandaei]